MSELKVDEYTRAPKHVIRLTLGGSHQDPPEVAIEVTGHARREWMRRIKAAKAMEAVCRSAATMQGGRVPIGQIISVASVVDLAVAALALLDPPTTTVEDHP